MTNTQESSHFQQMSRKGIGFFSRADNLAGSEREQLFHVIAMKCRVKICLIFFAFRIRLFISAWLFFFNHVVLLQSRQSHNQSDVEAAYQCVKVLDQFHGQANGIFSCDEHLAGRIPSRGE